MDNDFFIFGLSLDTTVQVYSPNISLSDMILSVAGAGLSTCLDSSKYKQIAIASFLPSFNIIQYLRVVVLIYKTLAANIILDTYDSISYS